MESANFNYPEFIEHLESMRQYYKPQTYRFMLAEILVYFFATRTSSITKIKNHTNAVLKIANVESISLGYVRNIVEK